MAARKRPVDAVDGPDGEDVELDPFADGDELEEEPGFEDEDDLEDDDDEDEDLDEEDAADGDDPSVAASGAADGDEDEDEQLAVAVPIDAAFDDEDDELVAVVSGDDEDDEGVEGLRDGEFVCRSCYLAKRETQLADPDRLLCRDCA